MSGPRSVSFLISALALGGGAETQVARVSRELARRGWRVEIVALQPSDEHPDETAVPVVELDFGGALGAPRAFGSLVRHLRGERPDALVCFMFHANVIGRLAGRIAGVPAIVTSIRNEHFGPPWRDRAERWTEWLGHAVTCNSAIVAQALMERGVARRVEVIPNCCDPPDPRPPGERERLRETLAPADEFLWLSVGSLTAQKDRSGLVRVFAEAFPEPGVRLAIAGGGPEHDAILAAAREAGVADRVALLGVRDDVPALLGAADGFVLSSRWEGSPNALIEAGLAGLPVVATETGGVRELVEDGRTGVLVGPQGSLCEALRRVTDMAPAERAQLGAAACADLSARLGTGPVVDRWQQLIERLVP